MKQEIPAYIRVPPSTTIQTCVPQNTRAVLKALADAEGKTLSKYVAEVLEHHLSNQPAT